MTLAEPTVLLVEESHDDALRLGTAFDRAGLGRPLRFARDRGQAIAYLRGDGEHGDRARFPLPAALLIDLKQPGRDDLDLLAWVRWQPRLGHLRIYVLSTVSRPEEIERAYELGASACLQKPGDPEGLHHLARTLITWLKLCHFPHCAGTDEERTAGIHEARAATMGWAAQG